MKCLVTQEMIDAGKKYINDSNMWDEETITRMYQEMRALEFNTCNTRKVWRGPLTEDLVIKAIENYVISERNTCAGIVRRHGRNELEEEITIKISQEICDVHGHKVWVGLPLTEDIAISAVDKAVAVERKRCEYIVLRHGQLNPKHKEMFESIIQDFKYRCVSIYGF